ncbi:DNA polymerase III subunit alpha [Limnobacter humi]|uniref:DNA polymerase III subunit alpha n=1 Tax=Limnobacter humi TaxID=1778671 RepID=A0ABT1WEI2_9BURK|nr:DNA polymerase III subunit alpha [Limnobacter humi]MCQ8895147.1 DNA polymerase III subunit alpha [Limnobacter humi]
MTEPNHALPSTFVHLRMHTEFSVIDGMVRVGDAVKAAVKTSMPALAISDLANLFGLVKFYKKARGAGVKPIAAVDAWVESERDDEAPARVLLLVMNHRGYLQLCEILSRAFLQNQVRGKAVIRQAWFDEVGCDGLIAISGFQHGDIGQYLLAGRMEQAQACARQWAHRFQGRFYLELQRDGRDESETLTQLTCQLAAQLQLPVVATHPIQFLKPEDFRAHEARVCIAQGEILSNPRRPRHFTQEQYFKNTDEMLALFADIPSAVRNTLRIAQRCNLELELGKPKLPDFPTPDGMTLDDYLVHLSKEGLEKRLVHLYPNPAEREKQRPEYEARLKIECDTIVSMGFPGYFLIVQDFINWGKNNGVPVGPGRGSGAGSLVAYALGITDLDPLRYDLLFERFLNPERVSMPDFDIDFCQDNRDRVIDYVKRTYGRDAVSQIATFGTLGAKAVIRDAGRVLDMPYNYCDGLSKLIPQTPTDPWDLERALNEEPTFKQRVEEEDEAKEIIAVARPLEGLTRNIGMHAGGVLIAPGKLTDFCPLYCAEGTDSVVSQYDKDDVEAVGLVKFDFLGLRNLTILDWAVRWIREGYEDQKDFRLEDLPLDDPAVYHLFSEGNTTAVFQSESRSAKDLEKKLKPDNFEDIIALMALNRPGPLGSGMVDDFIARKKEQSKTGRGRSEWYFHPNLENTLKSTYGVIVYQEQVMLVAQLLAGYSLGGADLLRRAMGKKKPEEMAKQREIFTTGATERGVDPALAKQLFDLMEKFAEYGFNKSHSAAYALVAYHTAWLKAHYPAEFMAASMSSDMDDTDKVKVFVEDALTMCQVPGKKPGTLLTMLGPDVNASNFRFAAVKQPGDVKASAIRYGLGAIKGTGQAACEAIVAERQANGPFKDLFDFVKRVDGKQINRRVMEALIRAGAFDSLNPDRAKLLASAGQAMEWAAHQAATASQVSLFGEDLGGDAPPPLVQVPTWSDREKLQQEKIALGYYFSGHLFKADEDKVRQFIRLKLKDLSPSREPVWMAGVIAGLRTMMTRRGKMAVVLLDDATAQIELSIFNEQFEANRNLLKEDSLLVLQGRVSEDSYTGGLRVSADNLYSLGAARAHFVSRLRLKMNGRSDVQKLMGILEPYRDPEQGCLVEIDYHNGDAACVAQLGTDWKVRAEEDLLEEMSGWLGQGNAKWIFS